VDIILATYRRPHTIGYSIQSALAQTYSNFTLHVVGDGCDAETERIVRSFEDPRIRFYRFPKAMGFGYAHRNTVLAQSNGPFIAYLTDDDLWFPDHLATGLRHLAERTLDLVAFRSVHVQFPDVLDPYFFAYDWQAGRDSWLRNWFMGAVGCVHRRSLFDTIGYWNDQLFRFGDREFYNRARVSSARTAYVDRLTLLRFFAQHWDRRYAEAGEPPQKRYLPRVLDPEWRDGVHRSTQTAVRSMAVRRRQASDFLEFAVRSGPKFARFWYQKLSRPGAPRAS
jgi:glycosyltransferase involved in cell wall biosynthesis